MKTEDADITVTSATRSEDEMRADLGAPADAPAKKDDAKPAEKAGEQAVAKPEEQAAQEAESDRPDTEVSEAARTLRKNKASERIKRLKNDIALYEDNVRQLGGTIPALEKREYGNPQDEIAHLSRRRHEVLESFNKTLKNPPRRPAAPAAQPPARAAVAPKPGEPAPDDALPTFEFPTWEEYQAKHPEAEYTAYVDARQDARWKHNKDTEQLQESRRQETERRTADAAAQRDAVTKFTSAVTSFKADHADYDDVTNAIVLTPEGGDDSPAVLMLRRGVLREGENGPAILYHLAQHPDALRSLTESRGPAEFLESWADVKYAVKSAAKSAAPAVPADGGRPAAPAASTAQPTTKAPAPMTPVPGGANHTRTLNQIADDGEDADEYIAKRKEQDRRAK